jgi:hypothetical protein
MRSDGSRAENRADPSRTVDVMIVELGEPRAGDDEVGLLAKEWRGVPR